MTKETNVSNPQIFEFEDLQLNDSESDNDSDWESVASDLNSSDEEFGEPMTAQEIGHMMDQAIEARQFHEATRPKTAPSAPISIPAAKKSNDRDFNQFQ